MVILVDMDDTIENLLESWVGYLNEKYCTNVNPDDVTDWDVSKSFPELTREQVYKPLFDDELWRTVKPMDGAAENLKRLIDEGHEVYIVTNSCYQTLVVKMEEVLFRYFPFLTWEQVILASNKQMIRGDVLIDDGIHNLIDGDYIKILMDAPHNRQYDAAPMGMYRVHNWDEVYKLIRQLSERHTYVGVKCKSN